MLLPAHADLRPGCQGLVYIVGNGIYNLYFHPLAAFPGPFMARASLVSHGRVAAVVGASLTGETC